MRILAFAASNSINSINKKLVIYSAGLLKNISIELVDLNDYELPLFSPEREAVLGHPEPARIFFEKIGKSDAVIISFAEHNGSYSAAYKNLFDWCSRINSKVFQQKPLVFLAASPGPGGAASVLSAAVGSAPFFGGEVRASVSIPNFHDNFDMDKECICNTDMQAQLKEAVETLL